MGASRTFDGTDDVITVTDTAILQDIWSGGATCAAWINPNDEGENGRGRIFNKATNATSVFGWAMTMRPSTNLQVEMFVRFSGGQAFWYSTDSFIANEWAYVTVTYDSDSASNDPTIYRNGTALSLAGDSNSTGSYFGDSGRDLLFGDDEESDRCFNGELCYMQIWNRVLSVGEIAESMEKPGSVRSGLIGFWPLLGSSPERDLSGNGNTGAVTNSGISSDGSPVRKFL